LQLTDVLSHAGATWHTEPDFVAVGGYAYEYTIETIEGTVTCDATPTCSIVPLQAEQYVGQLLSGPEMDWDVMALAGIAPTGDTYARAARVVFSGPPRFDQPTSAELRSADSSSSYGEISAHYWPFIWDNVLQEALDGDPGTEASYAQGVIEVSVICSGFFGELTCSFAPVASGTSN
jgi:hypothetical protein